MVRNKIIFLVCSALLLIIPVWTAGLWWAASDPTRMQWVQRVTIVLILIVVFFGVRVIIKIIQSQEHYTRGFCRTCGYDLTGLQDMHCPECNSKF
jgi:hypothetical protein